MKIVIKLNFMITAVLKGHGNLWPIQSSRYLNQQECVQIKIQVITTIKNYVIALIDNDEIKNKILP